jgi:DNA repair protein RadC
VTANYRLRICDLPSTERPRERLLEAGPRNLSTGELIAILLGTGQGPGKLSAVGLAHLLLNELGRGSKDPLSALREVSPQQLMDIDGIGPAKGATILAAVELGRRIFLNRPIIDGPETAHLIFQSELAFQPQERFVVLLLDIKNRVIGTHLVSLGTADETIAIPRDVFREAVRQGAVAIIAGHNHPSGDSTPSPEDIALTRQLLKASQILGITLLDHLVIGQDCFTSLRRTTEVWNGV